LGEGVEVGGDGDHLWRGRHGTARVRHRVGG
jgi:hypothetical protein